MPAEPRPVAQRDAALGGQAVHEGVMMRGTSSWAVAVRAPDGGIAVETFPLTSVDAAAPVAAQAPAARRRRARRGPADRRRGAGRGRRGTGQARAARVRGARRWSSAPRLLLVVPALLTGSTLLEGALRLAIFLAGVAVLSRLPRLRRAFGYHGAEHKAVACLEAGLPLTPDNARGFSRLHPRCGTGFLLVMVVVAGVVYLPFALSPWYLLLASRLLLFPLVVGTLVRAACACVPSPGRGCSSSA